MNFVLLALFVLDILGTVLGVCAMRSRALSAKFTGISGGVMLGVALFWIFPDMTQRSGAIPAALAIGAALTTLFAIDRLVYPVCPCCAHGHRRGPSASAHSPNVSRVSGTLTPVVIAICIHNLFDGWTAAAAGHAGSSPGSGIAVGLIAHKIPESVVFGLMLRNAASARAFPLLSVAITSLSILAGGAVHSGIWRLSEPTLIAASLALACGSFLFAGGHIFLSHQRHAGTGSAVPPLILGLVVSAAIEQATSTALARWH